MIAPCPHCARLAADNDELREQVRVLRAELRPAPGWEPPAELHLTPREATIVAALVARERCTREALMIGLYSDCPDGRDPKILDVFICHIRRKLAPFGLTIETVYGAGYQMPPADRARLREWGQPAEAHA